MVEGEVGVFPVFTLSTTIRRQQAWGKILENPALSPCGACSVLDACFTTSLGGGEGFISHSGDEPIRARIMLIPPTTAS